MLEKPVKKSSMLAVVDPLKPNQMKKLNQAKLIF